MKRKTVKRRTKWAFDRPVHTTEGMKATPVFTRKYQAEEVAKYFPGVKIVRATLTIDTPKKAGKT